MVHSPLLSLPCPVCCTCDFTKSEGKGAGERNRGGVGGGSLPLFSKEVQVKGGVGGNGIFYFPHNPDVGKKKDFLWVAALTLIFYADKIFPSKKKVMGKSYHLSWEAPATLTSALRRERKKTREVCFSSTVFSLTVPSAAGARRCAARLRGWRGELQHPEAFGNSSGSTPVGCHGFPKE